MICVKNLRFSSCPRAKARCQGHLALLEHSPDHDREQILPFPWPFVISRFQWQCTCFCSGVAESAHHLHSFQFFNVDWDEFQNSMYVEKSILWKKKRILWNLHWDKVLILKVGHNVIRIKLECHLKWFSTIDFEGLGEDGTLNSTTFVPLTLCAFSTF